MEADFWHQKWEKGEIGFHSDEFNPWLVAHFDKLNLAKGARVFVPLCGKTKDLAWLLNQGYRVVGSELSPLAVQALFEDLELEPQIINLGTLTHYQAQGIDIFEGDIFELTAQILGQVDALYDRAALVALPAETRKNYVAHNLRLTQAVSQLLIAYEYDSLQMTGPPFSVSLAEIQALYGSTYQITVVAEENLEGALNGINVIERTCVLQPASDAR